MAVRQPDRNDNFKRRPWPVDPRAYPLNPETNGSYMKQVERAGTYSRRDEWPVTRTPLYGINRRSGSWWKRTPVYLPAEAMAAAERDMKENMVRVLYADDPKPPWTVWDAAGTVIMGGFMVVGIFAIVSGLISLVEYFARLPTDYN